MLASVEKAFLFVIKLNQEYQHMEEKIINFDFDINHVSWSFLKTIVFNASFNE